MYAHLFAGEAWSNGTARGRGHLFLFVCLCSPRPARRFFGRNRFGVYVVLFLVCALFFALESDYFTRRWFHLVATCAEHASVF